MFIHGSFRTRCYDATSSDIHETGDGGKRSFQNLNWRVQTRLAITRYCIGQLHIIEADRKEASQKIKKIKMIITEYFWS